MSESNVAERAGVHGEIFYVRNAPPTGKPDLTFVTEDESQSTMVTTPSREVWFTDMRGIETSLDREGFILANHRSQVKDFDLIEEDPEVDALYTAEMTELLKQLTGASVAVMQGHGKKRYGPRATAKLAGLKNALPALYPHGDTTPASALRLTEQVLGYMPGIELGQFRRWAHINLWRPFTPPPLDYPLAVCDARSLTEADRHTVVAHTETRTVGAFSFDTSGYSYNPDHKWYYPSNQTRDEVLVFKTHDSDPAYARQCAHTAFPDPTCPTGVPPRGSVEMRGIVFFA